MALTTSPFHPVSGTLLPGHRDAYLRGDLSRTNTALVDAYLLANGTAGDDVLRRFQSLKTTGHQVQPVGWVAQQFELLRTEPVRFRQRASALLLGAVMASGLVFAGQRTVAGLGTPGVATTVSPIGGDGGGAPAAAVMTTTLRGRILDENGEPLVGATVFDKASGRGVSTNADGAYALQVPLGRTARLQYGFGGYQDDEVQTQGQTEQTVTLLPVATEKARTHKKPKHWWHR